MCIYTAYLIVSYNIYSAVVLNNVMPMIIILCYIGHSAKFGSYTLMDVETNSIVEPQLVTFLNLLTFVYSYLHSMCLLTEQRGRW